LTAHLPILRLRTAIAVASLATELIKGKTREALAMKTEELAGDLGPLPPMKNSLRAACRGRAPLRAGSSGSLSKPTLPSPSRRRPTLPR